MFQLIYLSGAVTDLQEAANWYKQQQAGRGHKFLQCIREKLAYLQRYAASYPLRKDWFREFFIRNILMWWCTA
ncbi:hypothetical protein [Chitinophaga sp.]|uniref:hypothetical protein n=1 Tax=Chitinophaga sp. TaxID=1869181 RepID=UPI0031CDE4B3